MRLEQNTNYEAKITLGAFESIASNQLVASKLIDVGFDNVVVQGAGKERKAVGIWKKATQEVEVPKQVSAIKKV